MFNGNVMEKIERGRSAHENTGTRMEDEFIGNINNIKYKELAYSLLHQEKIPETASVDEKYEKILKIREAAQQEFKNTLDLVDENKYINFRNSMKLVEDCQTGNPENPRQFFSGALYKKIKDQFEDKYTLKFFTSAGGTHLDVAHGIDCFFKLYDKETGEELTSATIDITRRPGKNQSKADLLFNISDEESDRYDPSPNNKTFDKDFFNQKIDEFAERIVSSLVENYKNKI